MKERGGYMWEWMFLLKGVDMVMGVKWGGDDI